MSLKVLFLDDEPELCNLFCDFFSSKEVQVTAFSEPEKAIESARKDRPDLIFLDYRLPGVTGDIVATKMPDDIPKILVTGEISVKTEYVFEAVIEKPVDIGLVQARIQKAIAAKTRS